MNDDDLEQESVVLHRLWRVLRQTRNGVGENLPFEHATVHDLAVATRALRAGGTSKAKESPVVKKLRSVLGVDGLRGISIRYAAGKVTLGDIEPALLAKLGKSAAIRRSSEFFREPARSAARKHRDVSPAHLLCARLTERETFAFPGEALVSAPATANPTAPPATKGPAPRTVLTAPAIVKSA